MDWSDWLQDIGGSVIEKAAEARYVQPYEIQRLQLTALGSMGTYQEGQPGVQQPAGFNLGRMGGALLIGGAVLLAVVLLKD